MSSYLDQLARVRRFRQRLSSPTSDQSLFEDTLWAFFQNCWHMKDWIKNDPAAPQKLKDNVEADAKTFDSLMKCADLANRSKHFDLKYKRTDATMRNDVTVFLDGSAHSPASVEFTYYVYVPGSSTPEVEALSFADQAIKDWETLIRNRGGGTV